MKAVSFILIWILVTLGGVLATTATTNGGASEPSKTDFLAQWDGWITDLHRFSFEYRCEMYDWTGRRFTIRRIVHFGEGTPNPFGLLFEMKDTNRLRDVQQAKTKDHTFTMVLPDALRLKDESGEGGDFDYQLECTLNQRRPLRFTFFSGEMPKQFSIRKVRVSYEWNFHTYHAYGEDESFWVPVKITEEKLIRIQGQHPRPRYPMVSEIWTLERIIAVREVEVWPVEEVKNKVKSENSDDRQGVVNLIEKRKITSVPKGKGMNRIKSRTKTGKRGKGETRIGK